MRRIALLWIGLVVSCGHASSSSQAVPPPPPSNPTELPASLVKHMQSHGWGAMHLEWHTERRWDQLPADALEYAQHQGWHRAERQEGDPGNGVEFLAMHRAMIEILSETDPSAKPLLAGWGAPPTDPHDATDPLPHDGTAPFDPDMTAAIDRLQRHLDSFASEDELGLYIETWFRPTKDAPKTRAVDHTAGIHNYLHQRFQDPASPMDLGNPSVNLFNPRFWRLHGWIDHLWTAYRAQAGKHDTDADYKTLMEAARAHMTAMRMKGAGETPPAALIEAVRP